MRLKFLTRAGRVPRTDETANEKQLIKTAEKRQAN